MKDTGITAENAVIDTVVVGAGQAGAAMSGNLTTVGIPHCFLGRNDIAEAQQMVAGIRWRANGRAWHNRFPGVEFDEPSPEGFAPIERVADNFEVYALRCKVPIGTGVDVYSAVRSVGGGRFHH